MRKPLVAVTMLAALVVTACSSESSADEGVASLAGTETSLDTSTTGATDEVDVEQAMLDFTQCLRDHGIDVPDPTVDDSGNFRFVRPQGLAEGNPDFDREEMRAAFEACQSELEGITLGRGGFDRTAIQDTLIEYAACMRDNGYDMDDPDLSSFGPGAGPQEDSAGPVGPFGDIDPNNPDFIAANEVCQSIFTDAIPRFLGGEGGRPPDGGAPTPPSGGDQ